MKPWHEDDQLWAELLPVLAGEDLVKAAAAEAAQAAVLLGLKPGDCVLDLGCGPGRHSLELARSGYRVTGVDRTACYLEHAQNRAQAESVPLELVQQSMLEFRRDGAFDGAISLLTSIGYFESRQDNARVFENVYASLKTGGRLVLDTIGKEFLARSHAQRYWQEAAKGRFWLVEREVLPGWEKMRAHWVFVGGGEPREFTFEHWLYSGRELADLMTRAGFVEVSINGGLDGQPYVLDSKRLVVSGRKA